MTGHDIHDHGRVIDQFRVDKARAPEERAWAEGFNAGKRQARKAMAQMTAFVAGLVVFLVAWVAY